MAWLQACDERFARVTAADVFIDVGDLAPVFAQVARVRLPGGDFAFSVETPALGGEGAPTPMSLGPQLHDAHGEGLLRALAADAGRQVLTLDPQTLRYEQGRPIAGLICHLARPWRGSAPAACWPGDAGPVDAVGPSGAPGQTQGPARGLCRARHGASRDTCRTGVACGIDLAARVPIIRPPHLPPPAPRVSAMTFDASAARALARKAADLLDVLSLTKRSIVEAAERGQFFCDAPLPEVVPVPAGAAADAPDFLVTLGREAGRPVFVEAVLELARAGYVVRPTWGPAPDGTAGRAVVGLRLDWSVDTAVAGAAAGLRIVSAADAHALSVRARAPRLWVERVLGTVRKAAEAGKVECHVRDAEPADSPVWTRRRELLETAGFRLSVAARDGGALATIAW